MDSQKATSTFVMVYQKLSSIRSNTMARYSSSQAYRHTYNEAYVYTVMNMFDAMVKIIRKCDH